MGWRFQLLADDAVVREGSGFVRASRAGNYSAKLSHGRTVQTAMPSGRSTLPQTRKERIDLDLDGLKAWPEIAELKNASGFGVYPTNFALPATWNAQPYDLVGPGKPIPFAMAPVSGIPSK